jgi:hypothetical protein
MAPLPRFQTALFLIPHLAHEKGLPILEAAGDFQNDNTDTRQQQASIYEGVSQLL